VVKSLPNDREPGSGPACSWRIKRVLMMQARWIGPCTLSGDSYQEASARKGTGMNAQELAQELGQPGAQDLLRAGTLARLAYNGHDGFPRVIPIGFYWNGERIVVCTAPTSPKVRALASRP